MIRLFILPAFFLLACQQNQSKRSTDSADSRYADSVAIQTATDAYIYGLPLVIMELTRLQLTNPDAGDTYSPVNTFSHRSSFPDASFRNVVRPNADTYYSTACLELSEGPLVLSLPDMKDRYYMMPMLDAYTNVFAAPGTRTTGNKAGKFLITGPGWAGKVPPNMKEIKAPTNSVWIIGRTQVNSKEDGQKVVIPLQRRYNMAALNKSASPGSTQYDASHLPELKGNPNTIVKNMPIDEYFNYMNHLLGKYPPPLADSTALERFAKIEIGPGKKFKIGSLAASVSKSLQQLPSTVFSLLSSPATEVTDLVNGWNVGRKVIGTYGTDYKSRAAVAVFGLGANLREDAIYPSCEVDGSGEPLTGAARYVIHFDKGMTPPANAFWSLTMYDSEGYFIDNPINRYAIGDRSNLKINADGSTDIFIQHGRPDSGSISNWLPAPSAKFNLLLRVYWPKDEMLNGTWNPPAVRQVK